MTRTGLRLYFVGIDPGISGGVGILDANAQFVATFHMPIRTKRSGRNEVDALELHREIRRATPSTATFCVVIEQVSAMPGQGVSGVFSLGDSYGCARTVGALLPEASCVAVAPAKWKRTMGLTANKAWSLTCARERFPAAHEYMKRNKDEARAEALLLALYAHKHAPSLFPV